MSGTVTFEQLFYGSGRDGYGILAASSGAEPCRTAAQALCESFGTPSGADPIEPFLLCRRDGDRILFARAVRGRNDAQGRRTIFVHLLVAPRKTLESAHADPFALVECGLFRESIPSGTPGTVKLDSASSAAPTPRGTPSLPLPIVVRASGPVSATLVRSALGDRPWERSWATWSWRFLDGFAFQGLSPRTPVPDFVALCDEAGKLLRAPATTTAAPRPPTPRDSAHEEPSPRAVAPPPAKTPKGILAVSLLLNAALAAVCAWSLLRPQESSGGPPDAPRTPDKAAAELAEILARNYPDWKAGSFPGFVNSAPQINSLTNAAPPKRNVFEFLKDAYELADRCARSNPASARKEP